MMAESSSFGPFMELLESGYDVTKREGADEEYLLCNLLCPPSSSSMLCFGADHAQKSSDSSLSTIASSPPSISTNSEARARRGRKATAAAEAVKNTKPVDSARQVKAKSSRRKIGDQIAALQQLVSPFGKTDTATVLHEAERYIRFLHEQVQVLSSPYLEHLPTSVHDNGTGRRWNDLRSRGLCLVPISCTEHMASNSINGADLFCSPSSNP